MARRDDETNGATDEPAPLRLSRVLHAPPETVFKAWSSAAHIKRWFCPEAFTVPEATVEMRAGGPFELCMRSPAGEEHWIYGRFVEVTPHARLVIDMRVDDSAGKPLFRAYTEVDFIGALGGTRMDVVQTYTILDPSTAWMVAGAPQGWASTLDKLEREVVHMRGGGDNTVRSVVHASFNLERTYDAPVVRVWAALTDKSAKQKWFCGTPGKWELLERQMDVRAGGKERLRGRWEGGVISTFDATYHDVIQGERLVYSYEMYLDDRKISVSLATIQLSRANGKTRLKLTEQGAFLDGYDDAGSREQGTAYLLDALGASLAD